MRRVLVVAGLTALLAGTAAPALAAPDLPTVPQDCHEWNALLHLENVRSCDPPPTE